MNSIDLLKKELKEKANPEKAKILQRFFKTGKGEYGEGDIFLGIVVPEQRKIAKKFYEKINFEELQELLDSQIHEERLMALFILIHKFERSPEKQDKIYEFYLKNAKNINNWDLVDLSAPKILGKYLLKNPEKKEILKILSNSNNLWEKRISIIACFEFIRNNDYTKALEISERLLNDSHDLIHKAVGWMLREIGKRSQEVEETFLKTYYKQMPRTMLRYAIEKFEQEKRMKYLKGEI